MRFHPWQWVSTRNRVPTSMTLLAASILCLVGLTRLGRRLENENSPRGIVSIQLAGTESKAESIIEAWEAEDNLDFARANIYLDFPVILLYASAISASCFWIADKFRSRERNSRWAKAGALFGWGAIAVAIFDIIEDILILRMFRDSPSAPRPQVTFLAAIMKFGLSLLGIAYIFSGVITLIVRKLIPRRSRPESQETR